MSKSNEQLRSEVCSDGVFPLYEVRYFSSFLQGISFLSSWVQEDPDTRYGFCEREPCEEESNNSHVYRASLYKKSD